METFLEYIQANYTWFILGLIIILLAIIGSYADKTNFGQGKQDDDTEDDFKDLNIENKRINDLVSDVNKNNKTEKKEVEKTSKHKNSKKEESVEKTNVEKNNKEETKEDKKSEKTEKNLDDSFEEQFKNFDDEFNSIIPKKDLLNEELLDDIDNLSLDKTQKFKFTDIPDLDDVDLPEIKKINQKQEDIWKF